jgi:hypothetical protein
MAEVYWLDPHQGLSLANKNTLVSLAPALSSRTIQMVGSLSGRHSLLFDTGQPTSTWLCYFNRSFGLSEKIPKILQNTKILELNILTTTSLINNYRISVSIKMNNW